MVDTDCWFEGHCSLGKRRILSVYVRLARISKQLSSRGDELTWSFHMFSRIVLRQRVWRSDTLGWGEGLGCRIYSSKAQTICLSYWPKTIIKGWTIVPVEARQFGDDRSPERVKSNHIQKLEGGHLRVRDQSTHRSLEAWRLGSIHVRRPDILPAHMGKDLYMGTPKTLAQPIHSL